MTSCSECKKRRAAEGVGAAFERRDVLRIGGAGGAALLAQACGGSSTFSSDAGSAGDDGGLEAGDDGGSGDDGAAEAEGGGCQATCTTGPKTVTLTFAKYPQLMKVGGNVLVQLKGYSDPSCQLDWIIVVQESAGNYVALSASCSHQCCSVQYVASGNEFLCPCHGSTFSSTGSVVRGPAPDPLQKLTVCSDDCGVTVTAP